MNIEVKRATLLDLGDTSELFDQYRVFYRQQSNLSEAHKFLSARMANEESVIFVARESRGTAVGFTQLYPTFSSQSMQRLWILNDLFVHEDYRRHGVASKLLEAARLFSSEGAAKGLLLCTQTTNVKAQALYRKCGFVQVDEFHWYFLKT